MSKIFEALHRDQGAIPDEILSSLFDDGQHTVREVEPADADTSSFVGEAVPARVPVDMHRPLPGTELTVPAVDPKKSGIRTLPIHLHSETPLLRFDTQTSSAAEQYRIIRTRLIQHPNKPQMLLISSAGPGDGKSTTAINVAAALSLKSEAKVLLVDTDFRRSTIHLQLGLPVSPGLADVLSGAARLEEALIQTEQFPNLSVMLAGTPGSNPSELLDSGLWTATCTRLRTMYRYIIADSPPVASVADYDLLQATCDGVIIVARPDHTKRLGLTKAVETVPEAKLLGVVMNSVTDWFIGRHEYYAPYAYGDRRDG
jgi:protein-tyrosine kinase